MRLSFTDDKAFCFVMQNKEICREILQLLIPEENFGEIIVRSLEEDDQSDPLEVGNNFKVHTEENNSLQITPQTSISLQPEHKSVRLDVLATTTNTWVNIEMQTYADKDLGRRSRYYQANMDLDMLKAGKPYDDLKRTYVIFFCTFDPLGMDEPIYFVESYDVKNQLHFPDEAFKIMVNTACSEEKIPKELKPLFAYIQDPRDGFESELVQKIDYEVKRFVKSDWRREGMTLEYQLSTT